MPKTLAAAMVAALGVSAVRRYRAVSAVAPELRTPLLWLPLSVGSRLELWVARRIIMTQTRSVGGVSVSTQDVPDGLGVVLYEPPQRVCPSGALLWLHGGGTVMGYPEVDHDVCSRMARDLGIVVVSARYRLAPEHPFPAGLGDCAAALCWLLESAESLRVDTGRIAVGGASAGGGLAASLVQLAHDNGWPVAFQLLVYPMLDDRTTLDREEGIRGRLAWTPRSNRWAWSAYLGHPPAREESRPYAVPARRQDLVGLPPAWIGVGDLDLFHDEDLEYARRLQAAGVPVQAHVQPGMTHGADVTVPVSTPITRTFQQAWFDALAAGVSSTTSHNHAR